MPRQLRFEYPGAIHHIMSCGNQGDPHKLPPAARLRRQTTLTIAQIAEWLRMGSRKIVTPKLHA
jgi:hypothetical protein